MDTSKDYYESFTRDSRMYGRGRIPEQFCRDEGADFKYRKREDLNQDKLIRHETGMETGIRRPHGCHPPQDGVLRPMEGGDCARRKGKTHLGEGVQELLTGMDRIKVEMDRTKDALERLGKTIEKWKITD